MTRLSRRSFLKGTVALGAGAVLYSFTDGSFRIAYAQTTVDYRLRLIHTNDHHSNIEPFDQDVFVQPMNATSGLPSGSSVTRRLGGVSRRKTIFDDIRDDSTVPDKIFIDAGDILTGTLYFNVHSFAADLEFYNLLGYDVATLGNHEFDRGDQVAANFIAGAQFPFVSANIGAVAPSPLAALLVDANTTPNGRLGKRTIITRGTRQIGVFGLTTFETRTISSPSADVSFSSDYVTVAQAQIDALRTAGCAYIIGVTHIGYANDLLLAPELSGCDVIIGGHSHTPVLPALGQTADNLLAGGAPLRNPADRYPRVVKDKDNNNTLVVTDWEWGKWVGDLTVEFDAAGNVIGAASSSTVLPVWANNVPATRQPILGEAPTQIEPDATFETVLANYKPQVDALKGTVVGSVAVRLDNTNVRTAETPLGNLVADAVRARGLQLPDNPAGVPVVALVNGGGIRTPLAEGALTVGNIIGLLPFGNSLSRIDLTGAQLLAALENGVSRVGATSGTGRFANVAGIRYRFTRSRRAAQQADATLTPPRAAVVGQRILSVAIEETPGSGTFQPLSLTKTYRLYTLNFLLNGGDEYFAFTPGGDRANPAVGAGMNRSDIGVIDAEMFRAYVEAQPNKTVNPTVDGRITEIRFVYLPVVGTDRASTPAQPREVAAD